MEIGLRSGGVVRTVAVWPLVAAALMLGGCASLVPKLQAPELQVTAVHLGSLNASAQQVRVTLHATNPNRRDIAVRGIDCQLLLAGHDFAQGGTDAPFTLPALGAVDFDVLVTANMNNVLSVLAASLGHGSLEYRLTGTVHLATGVLRSIPFNETGQVNLR